VASYLERLSADVVAGREPAGDNGTLSVKVLGRYNRDRKLLPRGRFAGLEVQFLTVHASKGLEADHIVVPGMVTGFLGFPSTITDDPVLALAMPGSELFPHAEERRLLYVALTRARRSVTLITSPQWMSPFIAELSEHPDVTTTAADGGPPAELCPACGKGFMVEKTGRFGPFIGCTTYPACGNTDDLL
jgi:DNA helicase IV